jgi:hypothetical protein
MKTTFFPFASGVPYQIKGGMYVVPNLDYEHWKYAFENKKSVIICHNGFLENLSATMILESLVSIRPFQKMEWMVNEFFKDIWKLNGLGKETDHIIEQNKLIKYPVPLFFNSSKDIVYLNCLNNYLDVYSLFGEKRYHDKRSAVRQIFQNSLVDWSHLYLPKMRNLICPEYLNKLASSARFNFNNPYILLIPDVTGMSDHDTFSLNWNINDIRSFAAMVRNTNYNLVILSPKPQRYYGIHAFISPCKIDALLFLLSKASVVLSKDVDFLISSLMLGNAKAFSLKIKNEFKIEKNKKFLNVENEVFVSDKLSPYKVFQELE